jgi:hypothetical protein
MSRRRIVEFFPKHIPVNHSNMNKKRNSLFCVGGTASSSSNPHLQKLVASHLLSAEAVVGS